ncbi:MAG: hypothetical protein KGN32_12290 [Burkholderiales bacterium]|nr:hypothetical protein [Burkholderiales bacterium]
MRDLPVHQAAGLMGLARNQFPRLTAFVSHGDAQAELPLLWKLCSAMVDLGYPVTVLDGTTQEAGDNPGLEQLLDFSTWRESPQESPTWNILPSMQGLQALGAFANPSAHCLSALGQAFQHEGFVIAYSNAQVLSRLLTRSGVRPLLSLSTARTSLLTSYLALKRLLLKGGIEPVVANVVQYADRSLETESAVASNLCDCARNFLDFEVNIVTIVAPAGEDRPSMDVQRLALSMIENAIPLVKGWSTQSMCSDIPLTSGIAGSH